MIYLFQIPVILTSLGRVITVTRFNLFFSLTFPITLLALIFLYWGVLEVIGIRLKPKIRWGFFVWVLAAVLFFGYYFITRKGVIETYALPLVGNIIFYLPLRTLIIVTLVRWLSQTPKTAYGMLGAAGIIGESTLGIVRNLLVIKNVLTYPPEFWYIALSSLEIFFVLQTIGLFLLVLGFFSFYRLRFGVPARDLTY